MSGTLTWEKERVVHHIIGSMILGYDSKVRIQLLDVRFRKILTVR